MVEITEKGLTAQAGKYFQVKQDELFWKIIANAIMVISTLAIAIATILTLTKNNSEIKKLREEIEKIKAQQPKTTGLTNPNNPTQKNSYRTTTKCILDNFDSFS